MKNYLYPVLCLTLGTAPLALVEAASPITVNNIQNQTGSLTLDDYVVSGSLSDRVLVVALGFEGASAAVSGVSFGAQSFSPVSEEPLANGYGGLWYLVNPTADIATDIVVTETSGALQRGITAFTLDNVDQSNPLGAVGSNGYSTSPPTTLSQTLTLEGEDSLIISSVMNGNVAGHYTIGGDLGTLEASILTGAGGAGLDTASGDGGSIGSSFVASWSAAGSPPRAALISAEFMAVPETSSFALISGVFALSVLGLRRRRS